jgi:hypothetical protein
MDTNIIENFVSEILDDDRTEYTAAELHELREELGLPPEATAKLHAELDTWGVKLAKRPKAPKFRMSNTSSHDRWFGPGSSPTHGGSGWDNIFGVLQ